MREEKIFMMIANMKSIAKSVELPNRVTLDYVEQGDADGVPVLLLHGITDSWRSFERVLPHLPKSIHAFAISQRGHGDASRPVEGYRLSDFVDDLTAFIDALKVGPAVIVGHSMSSLIAQRFALDHPELTRGLVLIGSFIAMRDNPCVADFSDAVSKLEDPIDPDFVLEFQKSTLAGAVPQAFLETAVRESLKVPARVWKAALESLVRTDHSERLAEIKARTLILWGDQDAFCPRVDQEALRMSITDSRLRTYPGVGHAPHWEEPELFAADLVTFCLNI